MNDRRLILRRIKQIAAGDMDQYNALMLAPELVRFWGEIEETATEDQSVLGLAAWVMPYLDAVKTWREEPSTVSFAGSHRPTPDLLPHRTDSQSTMPLATAG